MAKRTHKNRTGFESYQIHFKEQKEKLVKRGFNVVDIVSYTEEEYLTTFAAYRNDRQDEVKEGKRKVVGNIERDLVRDQFRVNSDAKARNIKKAIEKTGKKIKLSELRYGSINSNIEDDFWQTVKDRREELTKLDKYNKGEIRHIISQEFFGSP